MVRKRVLDHLHAVAPQQVKKSAGVADRGYAVNCLTLEIVRWVSIMTRSDD